MSALAQKRTSGGHPTLVFEPLRCPPEPGAGFMKRRATKVGKASGALRSKTAKLKRRTAATVGRRTRASGEQQPPANWPKREGFSLSKPPSVMHRTVTASQRCRAISHPLM